MSGSSFLHQSRSLLRRRPLVVGTLVGSAPLSHQIQKAKRSPVDLLEVRLDTFSPGYHTASFLKTIKKKTKKPLLLTIRHFSEFGLNRKKTRTFSESHRQNLFHQLLPHVALVDVEIKQRKTANKITRWAHQKKVGVIHSTHKFKGVGHWKTIQRLSLLSKKWQGDLFKVAGTPKNDSAVFDFLKRGSLLSHPSKVIIAMGKRGQPSRTLGYCFGSLLTYGHLGKRSAPGQLSVANLAKAIEGIYGK